jgi:hypothetical protein
MKNALINFESFSVMTGIDIRRENGVALLVAIMAMLLLAVLGAALVLTSSSETLIASNFRNSGEALYAADAALERIVDDLLTVPDWSSLLNGTVQSAFVDGAPSGARMLSDGTTLDLAQVLDMANCQTTTTCSAADMDRVTEERPWGPNNPRWQLYGYGHLSDLLPAASARSPYYVVVMVGDDPSELDGDATTDGIAPCGNAMPIKGSGTPPTWSCNPGAGVIAVRAEAFGPRGTHKVIEMTVARTDTTELERGDTGDSTGDHEITAVDTALVKTIAGARPTAPHVVDQHPVFDAAGQISVFGDAEEYNNGVRQAGVRILSWREVR